MPMTTITKTDCNTKELHLSIEALDYNYPIAKSLRLVNWVKSNISEDPGHFQSTTTLYKAYCEKTPQDQVVTETAFVQQIENIMSALMLNPAKRRFNKVRGYIGVPLKEEVSFGQF